MQNHKLHIVAFDNPCPPKYGGLIDVFYKIKALHEIGFEIYLHFFGNEKSEIQAELQAITKEVYFYKTNSNVFLHLLPLPLSVASRNNAELLINLNKKIAPILFESLKTTFLVNKNSLPRHKKILRLHNIEQHYFKGISRSESSFVRKIIFFVESLKYNLYEKTLRKFDRIVSLSNYENNYAQRFTKNPSYVAVFHGNKTINPLSEFGKYCFFHADLQTSDNKKSLAFIVAVFKKLPQYRLVVSSSSNVKFVNNLIGQSPNIKFELLLNFEHLQTMLNHAHLNICWSFQRSGTKLKVINCLFNSRFTIINQNIIDDSAIRNLCHLCTNEQELIQKITQLCSRPFDEFENRKLVLERVLSNKINAEQLKNIILE